MSDKAAEDRLFELVLYLVSSARLALDETPIYGSLRLVEGASRLVEAAAALGIEADEFLTRGRDSIEGNKLKMIEDHEGYHAWLTDLLREFAAEAARRNLDAPDPQPGS